MQAITPAFTRDTCEMHFAADELAWFPVEKEFTLADFEGVLLRVC